AADVIVIVSIAVDELYRIIACLFYRWHGQDDRLSAQVQPQDGIECVAVGRDYYCILVSHQARFVENLIERRLELTRGAIDGELVHGAVVRHDREAVDETLLGDLLRLADFRPFGAYSLAGKNHCEGCQSDKATEMSEAYGH